MRRFALLALLAACAAPGGAPDPAPAGPAVLLVNESSYPARFAVNGRVVATLDPGERLCSPIWNLGAGGSDSLRVDVLVAQPGWRLAAAQENPRAASGWEADLQPSGALAIFIGRGCLVRRSQAARPPRNQPRRTAAAS